MGSFYTSKAKYIKVDFYGDGPGSDELEGSDKYMRYDDPDGYNDECFYYYNSFENLSQLPKELFNDIKKLDCNSQKLYKLPPNLPPNLEELDCRSNNLYELPEILPFTLKKLNCEYNQIYKLPNLLPPNLENLNCSNNNLFRLPLILPTKLKMINMNNNNINKLPHLPDSIVRIHLSNNPLLDKINNSGLDFESIDKTSREYIAGKNDLEKYKFYMLNKNAVDKISDWFAKIKWDPAYAYCRKKVIESYNEVYNN